MLYHCQKYSEQLCQPYCALTRLRPQYISADKVSLYAQEVSATLCMELISPFPVAFSSSSELSPSSATVGPVHHTFTVCLPILPCKNTLKCNMITAAIHYLYQSKQTDSPEYLNAIVIFIYITHADVLATQ